MARSDLWNNHNPLTFHLTGNYNPLAKIGREVTPRIPTVTLMKKITFNQSATKIKMNPLVGTIPLPNPHPPRF
jgi:hypothetical protein